MTTENLRKYGVFIAALTVACLLPYIGISKFMLNIIIYAGIFSIATMSLNIIMGYTGQVSLAQGAFYGIGAYGLALLTNKTGLNFWVAMLLACLITALVGLLIGLLAFRTKGPYFIIVTLCFNFIVYVIIKNWNWLSGGVTGQKIARPEFFAGRDARYYLVLGFVLLALFITWRVSKSLEGLGFMAVRDNESLADALGINITYTKIVAFMISCFLAGLAGCLGALHTGYLSPGSAHYMLSFNFIIYLLVGGAGTLYGPLVGTFITYLALEFIKDIKYIGDYRFMIFGAILILTVIYFPRGIVGGLKSLWRWLGSLRKKSAGNNQAKEGA